MNFIIVTQGDILYTPVFFEEFFSKEYAEECKGVMVQDALGNKSFLGLLKRMYSFYGFVDFTKQGIRYVLSKLWAKFYDRNLTTEAVSIENIVKKHNIPVLPFESVNTEDFKRYIKDHDVDLVVSIAASEIFKKEILDLPKFGCINFHNAPLPDYRGMLPNFWQMYNDEDCSVLTVHTMTEDLDRGEIIYQQETRIQPEYSLEDLIFLTKRKSAEALVEVLEAFRESEVNYKPMPEREGSYFTFPEREDVVAFKSNGKTLF